MNEWQLRQDFALEVDFVLEEAATNQHYDQLSAVILDHWPLVLMVCRACRYPVPPQVWRDLLPNLHSPASTRP